MSTHCAVMVQFKNAVQVIYVHRDGYPSGVGKILFEHFNSQILAEALILNGNRLSISEEVAKAAYATQDSSDTLVIDEALVNKLQLEFHQSFCEKIGRKFDPDYYFPQTTYGEPARQHSTYEQAVAEWSDNVIIRYCYYWDGNQWHVNNFELSEILTKIETDLESRSPENRPGYDGYVSPPEDCSTSQCYESWQDRTPNS